jgi:hypothetical protein
MFQRIGTILGELFMIGMGVYVLVLAFRGRRKDSSEMSASNIKTMKICGAGMILCFGILVTMRFLHYM